MPEKYFIVSSDKLTYDYSDSEISNSFVLEKIHSETAQVSFLNTFFDEEICVPSEIFKSDCAPLQALVKYLIEEKKLSNKKISSLIKRDLKTIWLTYSSVKKNKLIVPQNSDFLIPVSSLKNSSLSILEGIVFYMKKDLSFSQIARLIGKDPRTIWTVYSRAKKKFGDKER